MLEAETEAMHLKDKDHQGLLAVPEAKRKHGTDPPLAPSE